MGVPPHELVSQLAQHIVDGERAGLRRNLAMKEHLKQNVAQLFSKLFVIASIDGFKGLVGFFEEVRLQRLMRLIPVPWAAVCRAQRSQQLR